ncbi:MAG TPA: carboxypeptidase regulatory-like domain-containing protein [Gemmatimonadaceae bacterium]|nr:carboxypeptidase regulatory-like domain-containing protein [Gemmatimonadaceae bacterium]
MQPALVAHAQDIHGRVVDQTGVPIALAQVYLLPKGPGTTSDFRGSFILHGVAQGTDTIAVRRLGFRPDTIVVSVPAEGATLTVQLTPSPIELQPVTTSALQKDLPRVFHRMHAHLGGVAFGTDLRKEYPGMAIDDILDDDWDLRRNVHAGQGYCPPRAVFIDGIPIDPFSRTPISAYIPLRDITAVEAFSSPAFVQEPFIHASPGSCQPIILIWSRGYKEKPWGG